MVFAVNGEYLFSGGPKGVQVWRVKDWIRTAMVTTTDEVSRLVVSKDGRWIGAGTDNGHMYVWDADTHTNFQAQGG